MYMVYNFYTLSTVHYCLGYRCSSVDLPFFFHRIHLLACTHIIIALMENVAHVCPTP